MIVNSTELQNNFGKYLVLANQEDIIVTRNGTAIAKLTAIKEQNGYERTSPADIISERAEKYSTNFRKATYEEFLELSKGSEERYEYIDGEIYMLASPKTAHQYALGELFGLFYSWFQGKLCRPFIAPYDIELRKTSDDIHMVQPDLMVICDLEERLNHEDYYKGIPALVVEILSESTRRKDLVTKLNLYMSSGIQEYWIVNPMNREVTVYAFQDRDIYNNATFKINEIALSFLFPGLSVELARIFRT